MPITKLSVSTSSSMSLRQYLNDLPLADRRKAMEFAKSAVWAATYHIIRCGGDPHHIRMLGIQPLADGQFIVENMCSRKINATILKYVHEARSKDIIAMNASREDPPEEEEEEGKEEEKKEEDEETELCMRLPGFGTWKPEDDIDI